MADTDFVTVGQMNSLISALASSAVVYVYHGATGSTARPTNPGTVIWVGTATPANANTSTDFWIDTT